MPELTFRNVMLLIAAPGRSQRGVRSPALVNIDDLALQDIVQAMREKLYRFRWATCDPWLEVDSQAGRIGPIPDINEIPTLKKRFS